MPEQQERVLFGGWSPFVSLLLLARLACCCPALLRDLTRTAHSQRSGRHILCDARARTDVGSVADDDRGHKCGVAPNEYALPNPCRVLVNPIVVACNYARTDVASRADLRIPEIGKVIGLGAFAEPGFLGFDKVADVRVCSDFAAGAQMCKWPDPCAPGHSALGQHAALPDEHIVTESAIL